MRARSISTLSLLRYLRNVVSSTIRPSFVNLIVIRRDVGPNVNRNSKSPYPKLRENGIRAREPRSDSRSTRTTTR